ncbi:MAG: ABC transporter ATP-binding protein [Candidatus Neomarinimicrobiota bacterium]
MAIPAIQIKDLVKTYDKDVALRGVDISIREGQFFGLLGPNGAGKTTTINILTGLVRKDSGTTEIFGRDTIRDFRYTRSQIGISAQEISLDWFFSVERLLSFQAGYYGISKKRAQPRIELLLKKLGLVEKRKAKLRQLSGGMKRRYQLAKALIHDPNILILDEPTAGVDVELRHELWEYLGQMHKEGKTILLTTHYIEEAELLCDKVAIIDKGKIITEGSPEELTRQLGKAGITIQLSGWKEEINTLLNEFHYTHSNGRLHFTVRDPEEDMPRIIKILSQEGCHIQHVDTEKSSLEDVFLNLTGKGIDETGEK